MNVRERVFERWVGSAELGTLTFEEWRVFQRERVTQQRQQQQMARRFANQFPSPLQSPNWAQYLQPPIPTQMRIAHGIPSAVDGLGGLLGGVFGR